jgi:hypothetical protein
MALSYEKELEKAVTEDKEEVVAKLARLMSQPKAPVTEAAKGFRALLGNPHTCAVKIRAAMFLKHFVLSGNLDFIDLLYKAVGPYLEKAALKKNNNPGKFF